MLKNVSTLLPILSVLPIATFTAFPLSLSAATLPTSLLALPASQHSTPIVSNSPILVAQQSRTRRVQFKPGQNSATIKDAVVLSTRDIYLVGAKKGQRMTVKISSLGNNVEFDLLSVASPAGQRRPLKSGAVSWNGVLSASGDYQIVVGATRGNGTYTLQITIK